MHKYQDGALLHLYGAWHAIFLVYTMLKKPKQKAFQSLSYVA
ncbi:hypothetical protein GARC_0466 [Paraglaciecola arctica BSs20135]|uniref:Uncharacterized protein n=1 Tax=Paraglaciecola arctica BSs20135 TaxID=493475 RepID=K6YLE5_9ALTE|nr:hypothetical protein GARC_0466 [Paraglaciecola arctica BSs20135]